MLNNKCKEFCWTPCSTNITRSTDKIFQYYQKHNEKLLILHTVPTVPTKAAVPKYKQNQKYQSINCTKSIKVSTVPKVSKYQLYQKYQRVNNTKSTDLSTAKKYQSINCIKSTTVSTVPIVPNYQLYQKRSTKVSTVPKVLTYQKPKIIKVSTVPKVPISSNRKHGEPKYDGVTEAYYWMQINEV